MIYINKEAKRRKSMDFDKMFETIDQLYEKNKNDDILQDAVVDLYKAAVAYTQYRVNWNFYSREQKVDEDKLRTIKHDAFIDRCNSLKRYLEKTMDVSWFELDKDRKVVGDFANYVVYKLAVKQR